MAKKANGPTPESLLGQTLAATRVAEVLRTSAEGGSLKVLFRVTQKKIWLGILEFVLARASSWTAHVCQQYFMRSGKLVYGWNFILRPNDKVKMEVALQEACLLLQQGARTVPQVQAEPTDSFPLVGASPRRTARLVFDPRQPGPSGGGPSHKGAYGIPGG
jgi:hypothetical protein